MFDNLEEATQCLIAKGLIKEGCTEFIIKGDFGEINLAELLQEYADWYRDEHDKGVYGQY